MAIACAVRRAGHAAHQACGVDAAIQCLEQGEIDLVLTDIKMPAGGGGRLIRWVRHHRPATAVVAMSGDLDTLDTLSAEADAYLLKPFKPREVAAVIDHLVVHTVPNAPNRVRRQKVQV